MKETGCSAVKLEGGARTAATIRYLTLRGIPVMGHIGMTPQMVQVMGGFKTQGRTAEEWPAIKAALQSRLEWSGASPGSALAAGARTSSSRPALLTA